MSFLWSLGSFIIAIAVLVSVHEYGHFWAARKCGIKVHRFSIGFGKVIWKRIDKHGTEFAVSMIPLGGYVKMLDGRNEAVPVEQKSQSFDSKSVLQRAFVIIAGPLANFIFAIFAYWVIYLYGMPSVKPVIESITPSSIAAQAHIEPNTQILAVDGEETQDWETINMLLATKMGEPNVEITLSSFGSNIEQQRTLNLTNWTFDPEKESAFEALGIMPMRPKVEMVLSKVIQGSPAEKAGLQIGDKILKENLTALPWQDFIKQVEQGESFSIKVERNGETLDKIITPVRNQSGKWFVGLSPTFVKLSDEYRTELKYLSGPISIAKGAGASANIGLVYFLSFMALISVNLGIMNLFPLPVLDGGHLVFLAMEAVKGKPVSERVQSICYRIGAALLLSLTVFALFNDFLRL